MQVTRLKISALADAKIEALALELGDILAILALGVKTVDGDIECRSVTAAQSPIAAARELTGIVIVIESGVIIDIRSNRADST
ncbi:MAG: hypothetical protein KIT57_10430 [Blastocatellales bacterium]|nr:hypothetical protein [Blastocatellales bacterium]